LAALLALAVLPPLHRRRASPFPRPCKTRCSLREQERLEKADIWHCDAAEQACHEEFRIFDVLLAAAATTLPGILAKQAYLQDIAEREPWMFDGRKGSALRLIEGFAASIANVWAVQS
jgi:hypothetical protein